MSALRRFVVLEHDYPVLHWDLMLEVGDVLRTWRLAQEPEIGIEIVAEPIADHRRFYLDYEGPVSGNRGTVIRWDAGTYTVGTELIDRIHAAVRGERLQGRMNLRQQPGMQQWTLEIESEPGD